MLADLYTDILICCPIQTSATFMSAVSDGLISHDRFTRMLSGFHFDSRALWKLVKPLCHEVGRSDAVLIIDDTIIAKPYTRVNGLVCYHFDHTVGRSVKGINVVNALYHSGTCSIPVAAAMVIKDQTCIQKDGKRRLKASITKNQHFRDMVSDCADKLSFSYVLSDTWYSSAQNMQHVVACGRHFIMAMKDNRNVALSLADKKAGRYQSIKDTAPEGDTCIVWVEQLDFPLLITKQVFKNGDGTCGILYLASSDLSLDAQQLTTIYQRRWKVEEYHKSTKQIAGWGRCPAWKIHTQQAHLYASMMAYVKVELLKERRSKNHMALRALIMRRAVQAGLKELMRMRQPLAVERIVDKSSY